MTKIKICGLKTHSDIEYCEQLGVDFIGLVNVKKSPRYIDAPQILSLLPYIKTAQSVVLFQNHSRNEIMDLYDHCPFDYAQLHGDESPEFCASLPCKVIKSFKMSQLDAIKNYNVDYVLVDHDQGGSGHTVDWSKLSNFNPDVPWFLAGGLNPKNVSDAIHQTNCPMVDVSSGVESQKGIKSQSLIDDFVQSVRG